MRAVTAASKFFFYSQRKNTADDVRESVKSWGEEVEQERGNTLAKIKQKNHHSARADPVRAAGPKLDSYSIPMSRNALAMPSAMPSRDSHSRLHWLIALSLTAPLGSLVS